MAARSSNADKSTPVGDVSQTQKAPHGGEAPTGANEAQAAPLPLGPNPTYDDPSAPYQRDEMADEYNAYEGGGGADEIAALRTQIARRADEIAALRTQIARLEGENRAYKLIALRASNSNPVVARPPPARKQPKQPTSRKRRGFKTPSTRPTNKAGRHWREGMGEVQQQQQQQEFQVARQCEFYFGDSNYFRDGFLQKQARADPNQQVRATTKKKCRAPGCLMCAE
eukprot:TRINITY_DN269_c0_g1_i2.p1 TRINITY_DN269_c0_g1~~TRINITY_DN269_c0_g1_i2.p1  ORF type:complete len:250 (-),score=55.30 TRINITY_DN269_c0_g1_i2:37-714(-)